MCLTVTILSAFMQNRLHTIVHEKSGFAEGFPMKKADIKAVVENRFHPAPQADYALGNPPIPKKNQERTDVMNISKNKNLFIRVSEKEKIIIEQNAKKYGLSVSEYLRLRALGYMPGAVLPEIVFSFNDRLAELRVAVEGKITRQAEGSD